MEQGGVLSRFPGKQELLSRERDFVLRSLSALANAKLNFASDHMSWRLPSAPAGT
jgi:hypothetical protein